MHLMGSAVLLFPPMGPLDLKLWVPASNVPSAQSVVPLPLCFVGRFSGLLCCRW